jgi:hypothetical protein
MPSLFASFPQVRPFGLENGQKKGRESFAALKKHQGPRQPARGPELISESYTLPSPLRTTGHRAAAARAQHASHAGQVLMLGEAKICSFFEYSNVFDVPNPHARVS